VRVQPACSLLPQLLVTTPYDQAVQQACEAERTAAALPGARFLAAGALVLMPLFAFFDGIVAPPELGLLRIWRALACAGCAAVLLLLLTEVGRRGALACGIAVVLAFGLNIEFLAADGTVGAHYSAAVIVALLAGWLALPWRPLQAASVGLGLVGVYGAGSLWIVGTRDPAQLLSHVVLVAGVTVVATAAAALRERERRQACAHRVGLESHARRQEAIASIGQLGFRTHDAQVLLERAAVWIGEALGTSQCAVWEVQPDARTLLLSAGVGWKDGAIGVATLDARGRSHPAAVLRADEPMVVEDFRKEKRLERPGVFRDHTITSGIGAVLRVRQRAYAVLTVYAATRREFTRDDVEFVRAAVRLLGSAMGEYRDEAASKSDAKASGALARAGRELLASLDPVVLIERVCALTREIVGCDQSSTWFVRTDQGVLEPTTAVGVSDASWQGIQSTPISLDAIGPVLGRLSREEVVPLQSDAAEEPARELLGALGVTTALLVVLRRDGEPVGVQVLGRISGDGFTRQETRLAQGVAQLAGMALTNAQLVQQLSADVGGTARGHGAPRSFGRVSSGSKEAAGGGDEHHLAATRAQAAEVQRLVSLAQAPRKKRLLFADDLSMARLLFRRYLDRELPGIELLEAFDGGQALTMVEAHRPDLVILDLQMPEVDGYEATRRIRALDGCRDLPIIATSITAGPRVESAALAAGFTEFVAKPVSDYGPLRARICHWLDDDRGSASATAWSESSPVSE